MPSQPSMHAGNLQAIRLVAAELHCSATRLGGGQKKQQTCLKVHRASAVWHAVLTTKSGTLSEGSRCSADRSTQHTHQEQLLSDQKQSLQRCSQHRQTPEAAKQATKGAMVLVVVWHEKPRVGGECEADR